MSLQSLVVFFSFGTPKQGQTSWYNAGRPAVGLLSAILIYDMNFLLWSLHASLYRVSHG